MVLDGNSNTFVVYITVLGVPKSVILIGTLLVILMARLQEKKALSEILKEYTE